MINSNSNLKSQRLKEPNIPLKSDPNVLKQNCFTLYFGSLLLKDGNFQILYLLQGYDEHTSFSGSDRILTSKWYEPDFLALISGLNLALDSGANNLRICGDSQFIIDQLAGVCCSTDREVSLYTQKAFDIIAKLHISEICWVPKHDNKCLSCFDNDLLHCAVSADHLNASVPPSNDKVDPLNKSSRSNDSHYGIRKDGQPDRRFKPNRQAKITTDQIQTNNFSSDLISSRNQISSEITPMETDSSQIVINGAISVLSDMIENSKSEWSKLPPAVLKALSTLEMTNHNLIIDNNQAAVILILGSFLFGLNRTVSSSVNQNLPPSYSIELDLQKSKHLNGLFQEINKLESEVSNLTEKLHGLSDSVSHSFMDSSSRFDSLYCLIEQVKSNSLCSADYSIQTSNIQQISNDLLNVTSQLNFASENLSNLKERVISCESKFNHDLNQINFQLNSISEEKDSSKSQMQSMHQELSGYITELRDNHIRLEGDLNGIKDQSENLALQFLDSVRKSEESLLVNVMDKVRDLENTSLHVRDLQDPLSHLESELTNIKLHQNSIDDTTNSIIHDTQEIWSLISTLKNDYSAIGGWDPSYSSPYKDNNKTQRIESNMEIESIRGKVNKWLGRRDPPGGFPEYSSLPKPAQSNLENSIEEESKSSDRSFYPAQRQGRTLLIPYRGRIIEVSPYHLKLFKGNLEEIEKNFGSRPVKEEERNFKIRIPWKGSILYPTIEQLKDFQGNLDLIQNTLTKSYNPNFTRGHPNRLSNQMDGASAPSHYF